MTPTEEPKESESGYTEDGRPKNPDAGVYVTRCLTHDRPLSTCQALATLAEARKREADFKAQLMAVVVVIDSKRAWDGSRKVMGPSEVIDEIEKAFPWVREARRALERSEP